MTFRYVLKEAETSLKLEIKATCSISKILKERNVIEADKNPITCLWTKSKKG